jgi:hypothetical protein
VFIPPLRGQFAAGKAIFAIVAQLTNWLIMLSTFPESGGIAD